MQMLRLQQKQSHLVTKWADGERGHGLEVCAFTQSPPSALSQPAPLPCDYFYSVSRLLPSFFCSHFPLLVSFKMSSGVQVADTVKDLLQIMKVNRSNADPMDRIRITVLQIKEGEINVAETYKEKDLAGKGDVYKFFTSLMKEGECCYVVYDCHYETKVTKKEDIVFVMWAHEKAQIKSKMTYASSKQPLKKIIDAKHEFEIHDLEELYIKIFAEKLGRDIIAIESTSL